MPSSITSSNTIQNDRHNDIQHIVDYVLTRKKTQSTPKDVTTQTQFIYTNQTKNTIQCSHFTYNIQNMLDQLQIIKPSSTLKNIQALDTYQQSGNEPPKT